MGKITEKAKFIDMYASLPAFTFGKDGKVYSRLGFLLTFLTILIIGGMTIWTGINICGRQKPSFVQYDLPPNGYNPTIPFNTDDFTFGLSTTAIDQDEHLRVSPLFLFPNKTEIGVKNTKCKFDPTGYYDFTCFDQDEDSKGKTYLDAQGEWYWLVEFLPCEAMSGDGCYSGDLSTSLIQFLAFLAYDDLSIDPFNYENPISTSESDTGAMIITDIGTTLVIELNEVEFISDNGWIFEDLKTETRLKPTVSLEFSGNFAKTALQVQIIYGGKKTVYRRTYPKIQELFAQIGGLITILTPIFLILVSPYSNLRAVQHIVNEIYEIKLNKSNNKGGNSPQKPSAKKKKRQSSKSKFDPTSPQETESNLLPQNAKAKVKSKNKAHSPPSKQKDLPYAPHAVLAIGNIEGLLPKQDAPSAPKENVTLQFETSHEMPSSPPQGDQSNLTSPQRALLQHAKTYPSEEHSPPKTLLEHAKTCALEEDSPQKSSLEHAKTCPPDERLNENLEPIEAKEHIENQSPAEDSSESEEEEEEAEEVPLRTSDPLEVPWQDWFRSFWKPNLEVQVLNKAKEHLMDAFDLVTIAKKVIEIDKLKACLLTHDQRVIFENLPSSVIEFNPKIDLESPEAIKQYHWKDSWKGDETALRKAYSKLKGTTNPLNQLLIRLYEDEHIDDGACL